MPDERSAYAEGKTRAEQAVAQEIQQGKSPWMILRPSQIFSGAAELSRQLGTSLGRNLVCLGGPRKRLRLVHVDDVARAIVDFIAPEKFQPGTVLNLTHPDILLTRQVAAMLKQRRGLRVFYLRSWLGKTLAWGTRVSRQILKRGPRISTRQAAYLFCEAGAEAKMALSLGWRPSAPLDKQIEIALQRSVKIAREQDA
jgi:nucleoside-diphosphate-sugar epimerase